MTKPVADDDAPSEYRLRSNVCVFDDTHAARMIGPDDPIPTWAARMVTNPKAWADPVPPWASDGWPEGLDRSLSGYTVLRGVLVAETAAGEVLPVDDRGRPPRFAPREPLPVWAVDALRATRPEIVVTFEEAAELERMVAQQDGPWFDAERRNDGLVKVERSDGIGVWAQ